MLLCSSDTCNDWILLIMRDHVSNAELSFFAEHLLPVVMTIKSKGLGNYGDMICYFPVKPYFKEICSVINLISLTTGRYLLIVLG